MSQEWKSENAGGGDGGGEEDVQMPLGVGGGESFTTEESYAEPKRKINSSTLALFAAFGAALVVLYLLGLGNKPKQASADEVEHRTQVDTIIGDWLKLNGKGDSIQDVMSNIPRLLKILKETIGSSQVVSSDLPGGESVFGEEVRREIGPIVLPPTPADPLKFEVAKVYKSLKLQMIMMGKPPRAMINGKIYEPGMKISMLTIKDIHADGVSFSDGSDTYELSMKSPTLDP